MDDDGYLKIRLTESEVRTAAHHAVTRRVNAIFRNHEKRVQSKLRAAWGNEVEAMCVEFAWCRHRDLYPTGLQGEKGADDSTWGETRWAQDYNNSEGKGNLLVYPGDYDDRPYVLFDGYAPHYRAIGWVWGWEAKQLGFLHKDGYYILARERVHPMAEFPPRKGDGM